MVSQSHTDVIRRVAETDATFVLKGSLWVGRCLICGGPLCFGERTGDGATIEHILPRSLGGSNDLRNLGIAHMHCNNEKGRHWDPRRRHHARQDRYAALLQQLLTERERRWREGSIDRERVL
jgi:5-methylcytosine-specific restriction endonuclease McrA